MARILAGYFNFDLSFILTNATFAFNFRTFEVYGASAEVQCYILLLYTTLYVSDQVHMKQCGN